MKRPTAATVFGILNLGFAAFGIAGLALPAAAQSTWDYVISDAGGGNSLLTWSVTGSLATGPGALWTLNSPFTAVPISAAGIYADAFVADGTPQSLPSPDGSYFQNFSVGNTPISGYYTYNAAGGGADGFGLMFSFAATHSAQSVLYVPGTQSAVIPVDFSEFNPGSYQSQMSGFSTPVTVNLTVLPVPEPSTLAVFVAGALGGLLVRRGCKSKGGSSKTNLTP
jgi:hypothetical protein